MSKPRIELPGSLRRIARAWLAESLPREVEHSLAKLANSDDVQRMAILPDVHRAGESCVGVALATQRLIYPAAVGSDIGCGIASLPISANADLLADEGRASELLAKLYELVPANRHAGNRAPSELPVRLVGESLSDRRLEAIKPRDARVQLGTLGRGNHFLEFQADEDNRLWLAVHSGSRAIGQAITRHHTALSQKAKSGLRFLDAETDAGQAYLHDLRWAIDYAAANRLAMLRSVEKWFADQYDVAFDWAAIIHTNHDHVRRETHGGVECWVHRKGAQSAAAGEWGIVPGSMGTATYHVSGRGCPESLQSCSHGAGRAMRRGEAMKQIGGRQMLRELDGIWFDRRRVGRLRDEAPGAYKAIDRVMRAQRELVRTERKLRPVVCHKGT